MESSNVTMFKQGIVNGEWSQVDNLLQSLEIDLSKKQVSFSWSVINSDETAQFLISRQKYLEYIHESQTLKALLILRNELAGVTSDEGQLKDLANLLIVPNARDLLWSTWWQDLKQISATRNSLLGDIQGSTIV